MLSSTIRIYALKYNKDYYQLLVGRVWNSMARRRKIDSNNASERITTSLRLPVELLEQIDNAWKSSDKYTGRTHFIETACNYYLDCEPCPNCGHLNNSTSVVCSHCEEKLKPFQDCADLIKEQLKHYSNSLKIISDGINTYDNLFEKIGWLIDKLPLENQNVAKDIVSSTLKSMESGLIIGRDFMKCHELYSTYDQLPLPTPFAILQSHKDLYYIDGRRIESFKSHNDESINHSHAACISANYHYRTGQLVVQNPRSLQFNELEDLMANLDKAIFHIDSTAHDVMTALGYLQTVEKMIDIILQHP